MWTFYVKMISNIKKKFAGWSVIHPCLSILAAWGITNFIAGTQLSIIAAHVAFLVEIFFLKIIFISFIKNEIHEPYSTALICPILLFFSKNWK